VEASQLSLPPKPKDAAGEVTAFDEEMIDEELMEAS
jgi:hypothetical protein